MIAAGILLDACMPLELRLIDLDLAPRPTPEPASSQEKARAERFRFARHRHRYLVGRAALRRLLADWSGIPSASLRFGETGNGKPVLPDSPDIHFNLSYSHQAILIGVGRRGPFGVDIEHRRPFPEARALAEDCFDADERCTLRAAALATEESAMFLRGWTRKEACMKATAQGLSLEPARIATGLEPGRRTVAIGLAVQAEVETIELDGYIASWARIL